MKKINVIIHVILYIIILLVLASFVSADPLDIRDFYSYTGGALGPLANVNGLCGGFNASSDYTIGNITIIGWERGSVPNVDVNLQLWNANPNHEPTTHIANSTTEYTISNWVNSFENYSFEFANIPVTSPNDYAICLMVSTTTGDFSVDGSNEVQLRSDTQNGTGVNTYYTINAGGSFVTRDTNSKMTFWAFVGGAAPSGDRLNVVIDTPNNNAGFGISQLVANHSKIYINGTHNGSIATRCVLNDTKWSPGFNQTHNFTLLNNTAITDGTYHVFVGCNKTGTDINGTSSNFIFTVDTNNPIIIPSTLLLNNKTIIWNMTNQTLIFNISFTDNIEIYSVNISLENGTVINNTVNIGLTYYAVNASFLLGDEINNYLDARVCDAHTSTSISDIDNRIEKQGIKYIMEDRILWLKDDWVHIYPKDFSFYDPPTTMKNKDRYVFTFNKKTSPSLTETFIVESSHYIDISKLQSVGGHLIIPGIGKDGYWVDLVNDEATKYTIKRIDDKKIEITITGLKNNAMVFSSIGELNCVTNRYYFGQLRPVETFTETVIINQNSTFTLEVHHNSQTMGNINATLYYNNTPHYTTPSKGNFSVIVQAPAVIQGNYTEIDFNWVVNVSGGNYNMSYNIQNVSDFFIDNCSVYTATAINFTLFDEDDSSKLEGDFTGTFEYVYLSVVKEYSLDMVSKQNFSICMYPSTVSFTGNYTLYYSATSYPQRRYYENNAVYDSTETSVPLYLLHEDDGIYVRFRVVDSYNNPISGVNINMKFEGGTATIEQENTDDSGLATFWVNPDTDYTFTFTKTGYETQSYDLRPTTSEIYTITLSSGVEEAEISYHAGIAYSFSPSNLVLNNNTDYVFMFNLTSSYWAITNCNLSLWDEEDNFLASNAPVYTDLACNVSIEYNTGNNDIIISKAIYELNNTINITIHPQYAVLYTYEGEFSLKNFIDDLTAFGEAGFNDFTRMFISFIIIFAILTALSTTIGVREPITLVIITIVLVWCFSYIGWLTLSYTDIPTAWLRKYIIAILILILGSSYIVKEVS